MYKHASVYIYILIQRVGYLQLCLIKFIVPSKCYCVLVNHCVYIYTYIDTVTYARGFLFFSFSLYCVQFLTVFINTSLDADRIALLPSKVFFLLFPVKVFEVAAVIYKRWFLLLCYLLSGNFKDLCIVRVLLFFFLLSFSLEVVFSYRKLVVFSKCSFMHFFVFFLF